ncbi:MAG: hypothetical protein OXC92_11430 [Flavobacteriaceae bacterium]|nr:hypothetical protein [Flavobacteriaceae bacterium]
MSEFQDFTYPFLGNKKIQFLGAFHTQTVDGLFFAVKIGDHKKHPAIIFEKNQNSVCRIR